MLLQSIVENSCLALDRDNLLVLTNVAGTPGTSLEHLLGQYYPLFERLTRNRILNPTELHRVTGHLHAPSPRICFHDVTVGLSSTLNVFTSPGIDPDRSIARLGPLVRESILAKLALPTRVASDRRPVMLVAARKDRARSWTNGDELIGYAEELGFEIKTVSH